MFTKQLVLIGTLALAGLPQAGAVVLPSETCGVAGACLTFGDFNVYSMAFLNVTGGYDKPNAGDPYYVKSTVGEIKDIVVFGTGATGRPVQNNYSGMNDSYATPNKPSDSASESFSTADSDPGSSVGSPINDLVTTWDADISALHNFLAPNNGSFVPYFNLNEIGGDTGLSGIDLQIWLHMWVDNSSDDKREDFYLYGFLPKEIAEVLHEELIDPDPNGPTSEKAWTYVHGTICVNGSTVIHLGSCDPAQDPASARNVDQNLGADNAAFGIYNARLDEIIKGTLYTSLHIDWRMQQVNNGYEQAFLLSDTTFGERFVPEPEGLALMGIGLASLAASRKLSSL